MNYAALSDPEILALAGNFGPSIIDPELFERAQAIRKINPDGRFGPSVLDAAPAYQPPTRPLVPDVPVKQGKGKKQEKE